jgi:hypothetical protein
MAAAMGECLQKTVAKQQKESVRLKILAPRHLVNGPGGGDKERRREEEFRDEATTFISLISSSLTSNPFIPPPTPWTSTP